MSGTVDILHPEKPKKILLIAANPTTSSVTGWPVGFWWAELSHPYWEFVENGYQVDIASPAGGALQADSWSDPRDESKYSADDLLSLGFINHPDKMAQINDSIALTDVDPEAYDAIFMVGGQAPMMSYLDNADLQRFVADFYETGKPTAVVCHATAILLKTELSNGDLLVKNKTWTGFADAEERFADDFVGQKIQPFWIEEEARKITDSNFMVNGAFKAHAVRDGNLITGQQQYSGTAAARLVVEDLGV